MQRIENLKALDVLYGIHGFWAALVLIVLAFPLTLVFGWIWFALSNFLIAFLILMSVAHVFWTGSAASPQFLEALLRLIGPDLQEALREKWRLDQMLDISPDRILTKHCAARGYHQVKQPFNKEDGRLQARNEEQQRVIGS